MAELTVHAGQRSVLRDHRRFKVVVAGRRWGKCLARGSRVTMADGRVLPVEDVRAGDTVLTLNELTYRLEPRTVDGLHDNGIRDTVLVRTAGRSLRCTPNHPLLVNNRWTEARHVKPGDLVAVARRTDCFGSDSMPVYELDYLAVWLAEGRDYTVYNGTPEIVAVVEAAIAAFGLGTKPHGRFGIQATDGLGLNVRRPLNPVRAFLQNYGLWGTDSKTKFIPECVYRLPRPQLARFLNLFMACDGSIGLRSKRTHAVEVSLANERMVRQLAELFAKFGVLGQVRHKVHATLDKRGNPFESWRFIASSPEAVIAFADEIGALSKEVQVGQARAAAAASRGNTSAYLPVSHDDFVAHLRYEPEARGKFGGYNAVIARDMPEALRVGLTSWRKQTSSRISVPRYEVLRGFSDGFFDPIADGDLAWEVVKSVEAVEPVATYDLTIDGNHNFFADGICTHNTQCAKAAILKRCSKRKQLIWYVAPTYRMARGIMWSELIDAIPPAWIVRKHETNLIIELVNGTRIELKGADKPDTLRGVGLHLLIIDEAQDIRVDTWTKVLRPTLASTRGEAIIIGTPKAFNWLYERYMDGQRGETYFDRKKNVRKINTWKSWQFPTRTSPFIPAEEIESAKNDMDERSFRQEFEASFETMSGRVYYAFDRNKHVGKYDFNPKLPIWIGQDFNIDPMSSVIIQPQPNGELWIVDEIVMFGSNTQEVADELGRRFYKQMKQVVVYPDPAGHQREHVRGESDIEILRDAGFDRIKSRRKHPKVADRVNAVNRKLMNANGVMQVKVDARCKHVIKALEETIYKAGGREVDKSQGVEHAADALGYCIQMEFPVKKIEIMGVSL